MATESILIGYTLLLACTKCTLKKKIAHFPTQAAFDLGMILTTEHLQIYKTGCLRCGTCSFEVLSCPEAPVASPPPVGWVPRKPCLG